MNMPDERKENNTTRQLLVYRSDTPKDSPLFHYWQRKFDISPYIFQKGTLIGGGWAYDFSLDRDPFSENPETGKDVDPFGFGINGDQSQYMDLSLPTKVVNEHTVGVQLWDLGVVYCPDLELKIAIDIFALEDVREKQINRLKTAVLSNRFRTAAFCEIVNSSKLQAKESIPDNAQQIIQEIIEAIRANPDNAHLLYCLKDPVCYHGLELQRQSGKLLPDNLINSDQDLNRQNLTVRVYYILLGLGLPPSEASFRATSLGENSLFIDHILKNALSDPMSVIKELAVKRAYLTGISRYTHGDEYPLNSISAENPLEIMTILAAGGDISKEIVDEFLNILNDKKAHPKKVDYGRAIFELKDLEATGSQKRQLFLRYHRLLGSDLSEEAIFLMDNLRISNMRVKDQRSFQIYLDYLLGLPDKEFIEFSFIFKHRDSLPPELVGLFDFSITRKL
jgi:hypothetical protein